jgi:pyruvate dehydrogenase E2 component (dihydrolipoamide acetyltransferase)
VSSTLIMPKMGDGMEEGTLLRWLKSIGDQVDAGDPIAEIETDKVSLEIEATESGVFTQALIEEGETVPIGTPIATFGEEGEAAEAGPQEAAPAAESEPQVAQTEVAVAEKEAPREAAPASPAPAGRASNGADTGAPATPVVRADGERLRASPLVKRLAAEHGIDLAAIGGTGPGGRIVKDDLTPYLTGAKSIPTAQPAEAQPTEEPEAAAPAAPAPARSGTGTPREMSRVRRTTGKRMAEAKDVIPHFYVSIDVEMGPALAFREQVNGELDDASKVSVNDLVVKAAALALREFPNLNTSLEGDTLFDHDSIDINVAVAIENGLIAPFVVNADQQSLGAIARATKDLIGRARKGGLQPEEYQGGTFTISNLGMFDVSEFIAIINPPQAAILAVGSALEMPVVREGKIEIGHRMKLTLSADHRVTDGAEVARFLQLVKEYLENPFRMVVA